MTAAKHPPKYLNLALTMADPLRLWRDRPPATAARDVAVKRRLHVAESTINAKGQTRVPASIRKLVSAKAGTKLVWTVLSDGTVVVRFKTKSIRDLAGVLIAPSGLHLPIEDLSR